ncbi:MAG: citrate/2-methylcitrate synthase, partial [Eubacteriales bacterium]|nr:citrate/2-methylcitrate synthase [Eubacteriales bacterium]
PTGTDTYSAIAAAVGSLKGPRHGGANIAVIKMLNDIKAHVHDLGNQSALDAYLLKILKGEANDRKGLVYGMGHAIYTLSDPRATILKSMAKKLADSKDKIDDFMLCDHIEKRVPVLLSELSGKDVILPANVDLYSGFVYDALDIPIDIATPLFASSRLSGWCAHRLEELSNDSKLMRPAFLSVQEKKNYVTLGDRKSNFL